MGKQDIYVIGADGSDLRRLTSGSGDVAPAWGLDGRILFLRSSKVFVMNSDGTGLTQVTHDINASDFGLSPDGMTLSRSTTTRTIASSQSPSTGAGGR